jgi:hypothetical protein
MHENSHAFSRTTTLDYHAAFSDGVASASPKKHAKDHEDQDSITAHDMKKMDSVRKTAYGRRRKSRPMTPKRYYVHGIHIFYSVLLWHFLLHSNCILLYDDDLYPDHRV